MGPIPNTSPSQGAMPSLRVDLLEGFNGDTVVVRVDGREVERRDGVRTNYSVGIAGRPEVDVPAHAAQVELILPERELSCGIEHRPSDPAAIAFSLSPTGQLSARHLSGPSLAF